MYNLGRRVPLRDLLGVIWVLAAGVGVLLPALVHGYALGPYDWLSNYGLSAQPGVVVHNHQTFDQMSQMIPWTNVAWTQVHHGQLPLWNPYSLLGMPLAFDWQSSAFGVPMLVAYLFPLRLAFTVSIMVTMAIAGTGVYVLGRVLRLGVIGSAMAATVFELSGTYVAWLGLPMADVMAWAGWLFAFAILLVRGRRRTRDIACVAVVTAAAVYGGQPEGIVLLGSALVVFTAALLALRTSGLGGSGPIRRPAIDMAIAGAAGLALGAPLLLPGAQLLSRSTRAIKGGNEALPLGSLVQLLTQGYDGLPVAGSHFFGPGFYIRTAIYVGVIGLVLAMVGLAVAARPGRFNREMLAFGVTAVVMALIVFIPLMDSLFASLPKFGDVLWRREALPMTLALAVLAGFGTDVLAKSATAPRLRRAVLGCLALTSVVLLAWWAIGRGQLPSPEAAARNRSFIWPAAQVALVLALVAALGLMVRNTRARRFTRLSLPHARSVVAATLLVCETAFLITAGAPLFSSSPTYLKTTPAEVALQRAVGSSLVGMGADTCFSQQLGIVPDVNVALQVQELELYDPLLPRVYWTSWRSTTGEPAAPPALPGQPFSLYCPAITSASLARLYGVGFILEHGGVGGPRGTTFVSKLGDEELYRVPGASPATLSPLGPGGGMPGQYAPGTAVRVTHPDPASWRMVTTAATPQVLRIRLTNTPGWRATIDGRSLPLEPFSGVMLQARIPAGHHVIELQYWPRTFSAGLVVALVSAVGIISALLIAARRRRNSARLSGEGHH